jgi:hypothetical protein
MGPVGKKFISLYGQSAPAYSHCGFLWFLWWVFEDFTAFFLIGDGNSYNDSDSDDC